MKIKNYSKIEKRFHEYLKVYETTSFTGRNSLKIDYDINGFSALESFYSYETYGKLLETKEPNLLNKVLIGKAALDFTIKSWAEGLNDFCPCLWELTDWIKASNFPEWTAKAVINLHNKMYNKNINVEDIDINVFFNKYFSL